MRHSSASDIVDALSCCFDRHGHISDCVTIFANPFACR